MKVLTNIERFGQLNIAKATRLSTDGVQSISKQQKRRDINRWQSSTLLGTFTPVAPTEKSHIVEIAAGLSHAVILHGNGKVAAFGDGGNGQLGDTRDLAFAPDAIVRLPQGAEIRSVTATNKGSFAVDTTGQVWAWGTGECGELGAGKTEGKIGEPRPAKIQKFIRVSVRILRVTAGFQHVLALAEDTVSIYLFIYK